MEQEMYLSEDRTEERKKTSMTQNLGPVFTHKDEVRPVDRHGLGQGHLGGLLSPHKPLLFVLALVIRVLDEAVPKKLFIRCKR